MSSKTLTETGFALPSAKPMPRLACLGSKIELSEPKVSQSGKFIVQPISISGLGAAPRARLSLLYRPEWLQPGFRPNELQHVEGGDALLFVYRRNIAARGEVAHLYGLCACDDELYSELAQRLFELKDPHPSNIAEVMQAFFDEKDPVVGYILRQQKSDTGETDENGRKIYVLEPYYEIDSFFKPDKDNLKRLRKRAEKSNGRFRVTFDEEVPF